jgi:hypothetical protein
MPMIAIISFLVGGPGGHYDLIDRTEQRASIGVEHFNAYAIAKLHVGRDGRAGGAAPAFSDSEN